MIASASRVSTRLLRTCQGRLFSTGATVQAKASTNETKPSVKSFADLADQVNVTAEGALLARVDPLGSISSLLNPWALRVYRSMKNASVKPKLRDALSKTQMYLEGLNKLGRINIRHLPLRYEDLSRDVGKTCTQVLSQCTKDGEFQSIMACMTLVVPRNQEAWRIFEEKVQKLVESEACSIETALLASKALARADQSGVYRMPPGTISTANRAILDRIERERVKLRNSGDVRNVFDVIQEASRSADDVTLTPAPVTPELFTAIGGAEKVQDSKELERLGAILTLLAREPQVRKLYPALVGDAADHGARVLNSQRNPVRLNTLRDIWEEASAAQLTSSYLFYKSLYEQVLYSITCEPMQLLHQEASIAALLRGMVHNKHKNAQLVAKVQELVMAQGLSYKAMGMELFCYLVELDALPFAMCMLDDYLEAKQFDTQLSSRMPVLSEAAKEHLIQRLSTLNTFEHADLAILVLHCGSSRENKEGLQLLSRVEVAMTESAHLLTPTQAVSLLRAYDSAGRYYPPIITTLNKIIAENFSSLSVSALVSALSASARLNDRTAEYIPQFVDHYFAKVVADKERRHITVPRIAETTLVVWSLAVLKKLQLRHFAVVKELVEQYLSSAKARPLPQRVIGQLTQIWCEVQLIQEKEETHAQSDSDQMQREQSGETERGESNEAPPVPRSAALANLPWYRDQQASLGGDIRSSNIHLSSSQLLNKMNITHQNEAVLSNGYVVDVFIPWSALARADIGRFSSAAESRSARTAARDRLFDAAVALPDPVEDILAEKEETGEALVEETTAEKKKCAGVVLEFDGPTHYESYKQRELGTTIMKRRHLQALGVRVANIPHWVHSGSMPEERRMHVLRSAIEKACEDLLGGP